MMQTHPQNQWRADQFRAYINAKAMLCLLALGDDSASRVSMEIMLDACEWECLHEAIPAGNG